MRQSIIQSAQGAILRAKLYEAVLRLAAAGQTGLSTDGTGPVAAARQSAHLVRALSNASGNDPRVVARESDTSEQASANVDLRK